MAGHAQDRPEIRDAHTHRTDGGEPLFSTEQSIYKSGDSLVVGITSYGVKTHDLTRDDTATVEIHPDGIWIDFGGADDGE